MAILNSPLAGVEIHDAEVPVIKIWRTTMHCFTNLACVTNTLTAGVVKPVIYRATEQWFSS